MECLGCRGQGFRDLVDDSLVYEKSWNKWVFNIGLWQFDVPKEHHQWTNHHFLPWGIFWFPPTEINTSTLKFSRKYRDFRVVSLIFQPPRPQPQWQGRWPPSQIAPGGRCGAGLHERSAMCCWVTQVTMLIDVDEGGTGEWHDPQKTMRSKMFESFSGKKPWKTSFLQANLVNLTIGHRLSLHFPSDLGVKSMPLFWAHCDLLVQLIESTHALKNKQQAENQHVFTRCLLI